MAPKLGVTLYSFNADFHSYRYAFEDCMAAVGSLGAGQGVEIVGPQMIRSFPQPSAEFEATFRRLVERYDLRPSAFGGYGDPGRITGRWATMAEQVDYLEPQIRAAARLGFPVIRVQISKAVLTELVPYAEKHGVKLGMEIHAPMTIERLEPVIERVMRLESPYLGFVPDCGVFCHSCPDVYVQRFLDQGVPETVADYVVESWAARTPARTMLERVDQLGGGELGRLMVIESFAYFGHGDPSSLVDLMPYVVHVHGKFFGVDETGADSGVRFPEVLSVLMESGYDGYISCEYEGHHWDPEASALDQIRTLQAFLRGHLGT